MSQDSKISKNGIAKCCQHYYVWCHDNFGFSFWGQNTVSNVLTSLELTWIFQIEVESSLWSLCRPNHGISSSTKNHGTTNQSVQYSNLIFDFWWEVKKWSSPYLLVPDQSTDQCSVFWNCDWARNINLAPLQNFMGTSHFMFLTFVNPDFLYKSWNSDL